MAKQKYSTAAGFHIQLLPFTPSPKARPQQKSRQVRQHHPTGHQLDRSELFQLQVIFFVLLFDIGSCFLLSLLSFFLPPVIHRTFWRQTEKGASTAGARREGERVMPARTVPAVSLTRRSARRQGTTRVTARRLTPSLESPRKLWASRLPGQVILLLRDTQGHMRKHFPSEGPSPVEALSTCKLCCGSKDVHPQAFAPFHAWPWPPAMGRCLCERVALILDAACQRREQKWERNCIPPFSHMCELFLRASQYTGSRTGFFFTLVQSSHPKRKRLNLKLSSVGKDKQSFGWEVFQAVCSTLGFWFSLASFTLWLDKLFLSLDLSRPLPHQPTCSYPHACFNEPSLYPSLHTKLF